MIPAKLVLQLYVVERGIIATDITTRSALQRAMAKATIKATLTLSVFNNVMKGLLVKSRPVLGIPKSDDAA